MITSVTEVCLATNEAKFLESLALESSFVNGFARLN